MREEKWIQETQELKRREDARREEEMGHLTSVCGDDSTNPHKIRFCGSIIVRQED